MEKLLEFLSELSKRNINHKLASYREETIMVEIALPGERWEVEFFADGEIEVEIFHSTESGVVGGDEAQAALRHLITDFGEL